MWSGIHPINSGMYGASQQSNRWYNNVVLSSKKTLFEHFIDEGYYSYATGKIHHNGHEQPYSTIMRNDDNTVGFEGQGKYKLQGNINNSFVPVLLVHTQIMDLIQYIMVSTRHGGLLILRQRTLVLLTVAMVIIEIFHHMEHNGLIRQVALAMLILQIGM